MTDFAEFQPPSWYEEGLLTPPPRRKRGWVGTRTAQMAFGVALSVVGAWFGSNSTLEVAARGHSESTPISVAPYGSDAKPDKDVVPRGYWQNLGKIVAALPTLPETQDDDIDSMV